MNPSNKPYKIILKPLADAKHRNDPEWEPTPPVGPGQQRQRVSQSHDKQRVIYADLIKAIDDGTMLAGIDPGRYQTSSSIRGSIKASRGHAKWLRDRRNNPEFYTIGHTKPGTDPSDPSHTDYIITRHFKSILSINLDNIISINGKPVMGRVDDAGLNSGVSRLDIDENWSVNKISDLLEE